MLAKQSMETLKVKANRISHTRALNVILGGRWSSKSLTTSQRLLFGIDRIAVMSVCPRQAYLSLMLLEMFKQYFNYPKNLKNQVKAAKDQALLLFCHRVVHLSRAPITLDKKVTLGPGPGGHSSQALVQLGAALSSSGASQFPLTTCNRIYILKSLPCCSYKCRIDGTEEEDFKEERQQIWLTEMFNRGYVAATVDYAASAANFGGCHGTLINGNVGVVDKAKDMFDKDDSDSVINQLCNKPY